MLHSQLETGYWDNPNGSRRISFKIIELSSWVIFLEDESILSYEL